MYFKKHTQLDVQRQMHSDVARNWVVTLEGIDLCHVEWYKILAFFGTPALLMKV